MWPCVPASSLPQLLVPYTHLPCPSCSPTPHTFFPLYLPPHSCSEHLTSLVLCCLACVTCPLCILLLPSLYSSRLSPRLVPALLFHRLATATSACQLTLTFLLPCLTKLSQLPSSHSCLCPCLCPNLTASPHHTPCLQPCPFPVPTIAHPACLAFIL